MTGEEGGARIGSSAAKRGRKCSSKRKNGGHHELAIRCNNCPDEGSSKKIQERIVQPRSQVDIVEELCRNRKEVLDKIELLHL